MTESGKFLVAAEYLFEKTGLGEKYVNGFTALAGVEEKVSEVPNSVVLVRGEYLEEMKILAAGLIGSGELGAFYSEAEYSEFLGML